MLQYIIEYIIGDRGLLKKRSKAHKNEVKRQTSVILEAMGRNLVIHLTIFFFFLLEFHKKCSIDMF